MEDVQVEEQEKQQEAQEQHRPRDAGANQGAAPASAQVSMQEGGESTARPGAATFRTGEVRGVAKNGISKQ